MSQAIDDAVEFQAQPCINHRLESRFIARERALGAKNDSNNKMTNMVGWHKLNAIIVSCRGCESCGDQRVESVVFPNRGVKSPKIASSVIDSKKDIFTLNCLLLEFMN